MISCGGCTRHRFNGKEGARQQPPLWYGSKMPTLVDVTYLVIDTWLSVLTLIIDTDFGHRYYDAVRKVFMFCVAHKPSYNFRL